MGKIIWFVFIALIGSVVLFPTRASAVSAVFSCSISRSISGLTVTYTVTANLECIGAGDACGSVPPGGIMSYVVMYGDGEIKFGSDPVTSYTHTYATGGTYSARATCFYDNDAVSPALHISKASNVLSVSVFSPSPTPSVSGPPGGGAVNNYSPVGWMDYADCSTTGGWAFDQDYGGSIWVHFYRDGPSGGGGVFMDYVLANGSRPDVGGIYPGHTNSGWTWTIPGSLKNGLPHSIYAYAINVDSAGNPGGAHPLLSGVPKSITCAGDTTPPAGTITAVATPRNTRLTSSGQSSGTIAGTASDNVSVTTLMLTIREWNGLGAEGGCNANNRDWNGTGWQTACTAWVTPAFTPGPSVAWSYSGTPTESQMTSGRRYRVYLNAADAAGNNSNWVPNTLILFDNTPPTGTITAIPNPTATRLTSSGSPNGTVAGTAQDDFTGIAAIQMVIRRGDGSVCNDWNGSAWVSTCAITTPNPTLAGSAWTFGSTPPVAQMTDGQTYRVWIAALDGAGNWNNWGVYTPLILYQLPNQAPTASSVKAQEPDYCTTGPSVTVSWNYFDAEMKPQSAYQIQVDNSGGFGSPEFDSGKRTGTITSYYVGSGLTWGTTYRSRVRVWDDKDLVSPWTEQSLCVGPPGNPSGCSGDQRSWRSPQNQYPTNVSTFSWAPEKIIIDKVIQFDDAQTTCYKTPPNTVDTCLSWNWTFGDGGTSTLQDPTHTFSTAGAYQVALKATDSLNGYACSATKTLNAQKPIPNWREVIPK